MPLLAFRPNDRKFALTDPDMLHCVRSMFVVVSILMTATFFYASAVPFLFVVPDYRARLTGIFAPLFWESGRAFDWIVNLLALVPLGFFWSGTLVDQANTVALPRRGFCRVPLGCLSVAALAEALQIWLPQRVPSLRDLVALECGAILGCSLWHLLGARTTNICCLMLHRLAVSRKSRLWTNNWGALFGFAFTLCLGINTWASPSECFEMYRHRTFSRAAGTAPRVFDAGSVLLSSTQTALILTGLCILGVRRLEPTSQRPAVGLGVLGQESFPEPGVSIAVRGVADVRKAGAKTNRAA